MTDEVVEVSNPQIEKLVRVYLKMNAAHLARKAEYEAEEKSLKDQMAKVKQGLLEFCKEHGTDSVKTSEGLFYRTVRSKYWTSDWDSMNKFILEHSVPEFYEKRLCQGVVKEFLESNPDLLPPGLNVDSAYSVTVQKRRK